MVKKFYMETKDSTLESAILDVWKNAAENNMSGESSFEMGTDRYREHTQKMTPGQMEEEELEEHFQFSLEAVTYILTQQKQDKERSTTTTLS